MGMLDIFKKPEQKDISPKVSRLEQPEESLIVDSNAKTSKNTLLKSTVIAGAALKTLIPDPGMTTEVPTLESNPSMKQESVIDNKIIPLKDKIEQEIGRPVTLEPTKGINKQTDYQEIPLTKSHQQWLAKFEITLDTDKNMAIWLDKESGREFILPQNISTILSEDTWLNPDTYNRRDNHDGTATITDPETALEIIIPNTISNDKWRYLNESDTAPDKYPLDLQKNKTVVPVDGYDAAGYMLKKSGKMQPIEEKDRVRTPENAVDPDRLEKEKDTYYNAYDTAMENGDTFVSPTEKKVSPEQIKADLEKYYEASNNKEILKETLPNDDNETPSLDDSIPEKTPDSQSSEKLDSEVSTFEIPSDPEQAKKFADKVIPGLLDLIKKFPGVLTSKNALLLTTLATSGLQAANNADAANLNAVYDNLNPASTYVESLSSEEAHQYKASQIHLDYLKWQEKNMFKQALSSLTLEKYAEEFDLDEAAYQAVVEAKKRFKNNTGRASFSKINHLSGSSPTPSDSILKKTGFGSNYKLINKVPPLSYNTPSGAFPKKQSGRFEASSANGPVSVPAGSYPNGIDISPDNPL